MREARPDTLTRSNLLSTLKSVTVTTHEAANLVLRHIIEARFAEFIRITTACRHRAEIDRAATTRMARLARVWNERVEPEDLLVDGRRAIWQ